MRTIRIGLGSNDGRTIVKDHMGQAKDFYVFDLSEKGDYRQVDKRSNTSPEEEKHGLDEKRVSVMDILKDCQVFVGGRMSPNFVKVRDRTKFQPMVSKIYDIDAFMKAVAKDFDRIYDLVDERRRGKRPKEIPVIEEEA